AYCGGFAMRPGCRFWSIRASTFTRNRSSTGRPSACGRCLTAASTSSSPMRLYIRPLEASCLKRSLDAAASQRFRLIGQAKALASHRPEYWGSAILAIFLAYPAHAVDIFIENGGKFGTAEARRVEILARLASDRQHLIIGRVGMLAAIALVACQPLLIVLKQCGAGIANTGMGCQNELRHVCE